MSFIVTKKHDSAYRKMVIRQQVTDVLVYGQITLVHAQAKKIQRYVDKMITLAKKNTLHTKRKILSFVLDNKQMDKNAVLKKLVDTIAKKYGNRHGGYTRVLHLANRDGDNSKMAIIQLV